MSIEKTLRRLRVEMVELFLAAFPLRYRRLLAWRAMMVCGLRSASFERDNVIWSASNDLMGFSLWVDGGFQTSQIKALLNLAREMGLLRPPRDVFIDVGANIGTTTIPFVVESGCRALAIEPVSENFRHLQSTVESNGLSARVVVAQRAVANAPGRVRMALTSFSSGSHFVAPGGVEAARDDLVGYEEVSADTLANILAASGFSLDEVGLVWADVQGCELSVIESGAALWQRGVPLWAEIEPHSLALQGTLEGFADAVARHFDRYIDASDLLRMGARAVPRPIAAIRELIARITPEEANRDVLLLPPGAGVR